MTQAQINSIPVNQRLTDDAGKMDLKWVIFIQSILQGDPGQTFTPDIQGLTSVGTPTLTGIFYQNQGFIDFSVLIVPETSTTSTAGTTFINLPFDVDIDAPCFAVNGNVSSLGGIVAATKRAYPPSWSAITNPITITGRVVSQ